MSQVDRMFQALDALHSALMRGDFAAMEAVAQRIDAALADFEAASPATGDLQEIGARATRIAALIEAAGRGLAAARRRMAEIEQVRRGAATYAGDGRRRIIAPPAESPRRA